jgi:hypothetical protein
VRHNNGWPGFWAVCTGRKKKYGLLLVLPFFFLMQLVAVGFNIGVLSATLFKVLATDIAFGWQSTLQLGSEAVLRLVQAIALPWSWLVPEHLAYPNLEQISGSQLVLKDGIYHLATGNLVSWWPFLCLAVGVYGLLPRLVLLLAGCLKERSLLASLPFNTASHRQLLQRMATPRLSTESKPEVTTTVQPAITPEAVLDPVGSPHVTATGRGAEQQAKVDTGAPDPGSKAPEPDLGEQVVVLVPDELFEDCSAQELSALVTARLGRQITSTQRFDLAEDVESLPVVRQKEQQPPVDSILMLQEAWQPPIEDFFYLLRQLRAQLGPEVLLSILLIGKPKAETIFTETRTQDYTIWQQKIVALGDPYVECLQLVSS